MPSPFRALTACKSTVSGSTISLRSRGSFHLSLTVLCAIGSCIVFSIGEWSPQLPTGFLVSRRTRVSTYYLIIYFAYGTFTLSDQPSQDCSAINNNRNRLPYTHRQLTPQPPIRNGVSLTRIRFVLFPFRSPLLRESLRFLFLMVLRWFTSHSLASFKYLFP